MRNMRNIRNIQYPLLDESARHLAPAFQDRTLMYSSELRSQWISPQSVRYLFVCPHEAPRLSQNATHQNDPQQQDMMSQ